MARVKASVSSLNLPCRAKASLSVQPVPRRLSLWLRGNLRGPGNNKVVRKPQFLNNFPGKKREFAAIVRQIQRDLGENREVLEQV
jgi:hypothetical protein